MNILVVCHEYPRPDVASSNKRLLVILELISKHHHVDVFCPEPTRSQVEPRYEILYRSIGVGIIFGDSAAFSRQLLRRVYEVCLFEWWVTVPIAIDRVRGEQPWTTLIVDAVDVCFRREEAAAALGQMDPVTVAQNRRQEIEAYGAADALLAVTAEDKATLRSCGLTSPIFFIPNIEPVKARLARARDRELLFVGSFGINAANVDGVLWFVESVWPMVRESVPEAKLTLVGSNLTPEIESLSEVPGVQVVGFAPDLEPYLDRAAISIAPLRFGGGMKGKVTEAMSHGLPVVTTRFGVQGLEATSGEHLIAADDAREFAQGIIELLQDEGRAERIGLAGQRLIAGLCSPEVVETEVEAFLSWSASRNLRRPRLSLLGWSMKSTADRALSSTQALAKRVAPTFLWDGLRSLKKWVRAGTT